MRQIRIEKGLDLPISGAPEPIIEEGPSLRHVAVTGTDYLGMKPRLWVEEGDKVKLGQLLFEDKKNPGVHFTSPGSGTVRAIHRGAKRLFLSIVIALDGDEKVEFESYRPDELVSLDSSTVRNQLNQAGLWSCLRTRPFSKIPSLESVPEALFVTAIDTNPLSADPAVVLSHREVDFVNGLKVLGRICGKKIYLCRGPSGPIPGGDLPHVEPVLFEGPHPAGLPGTHIHFLDPVHQGKKVWYLNYQDVAAIGYFFTHGEIDPQRVISLAGPMIQKPRLLRTRLGASIPELTENQLRDGAVRLISGNVLRGRKVEEGLRHLGRYDLQVTAIEEPQQGELFGWISPGFKKHSLTRTVISAFEPLKKFQMTAASHGGHRAIYPVEQFERVMPLEILPVFLFRALEIGDVEQAEALGCLELDEEDLALCTYADPGKNDYGRTLRDMLETIEKEG